MAQDKVIIEVTNMAIFAFICTKTYLVGTHWNCLSEAIPMSAYKICFSAKQKNYCPEISL